MGVTHQEVPVRVNAWVDEGVAELVVALNTIPGVQILDSCQGDASHGLASVMFCTHDEAALFEVVAQLARVIDQVPHDRVSLVLWWGDDGGPAVADLRCPVEGVAALAEAVRRP